MQLLRLMLLMLRLVLLMLRLRLMLLMLKVLLLPLLLWLHRLLHPVRRHISLCCWNHLSLGGSQHRRVLVHHLLRLELRNGLRRIRRRSTGSRRVRQTCPRLWLLSSDSMLRWLELRRRVRARACAHRRAALVRHLDGGRPRCLALGSIDHDVATSWSSRRRVDKIVAGLHFGHLWSWVLGCVRWTDCSLP